MPDPKITFPGWVLGKIYGCCAIMLGLVFFLNTPAVGITFLAPYQFMLMTSYILLFAVIDAVEVIIDKEQGRLWVAGGIAVNALNLFTAVVVIGSLQFNYFTTIFAWPYFYYMFGVLLVIANLAWLFEGE